MHMSTKLRIAIPIIAILALIGGIFGITAIKNKLDDKKEPERIIVDNSLTADTNKTAIESTLGEIAEKSPYLEVVDDDTIRIADFPTEEELGDALSDSDKSALYRLLNKINDPANRIVEILYETEDGLIGLNAYGDEIFLRRNGQDLATLLITTAANPTGDIIDLGDGTVIGLDGLLYPKYVTDEEGNEYLNPEVYGDRDLLTDISEDEKHPTYETVPYEAPEEDDETLDSGNGTGGNGNSTSSGTNGSSGNHGDYAQAPSNDPGVVPPTNVRFEEDNGGVTTSEELEGDAAEPPDVDEVIPADGEPPEEAKTVSEDEVPEDILNQIKDKANAE